jgi:hypothetical protein
MNNGILWVYPFALSVYAFLAQSVSLDWATKAGTLPMQALLLMAICVLGYVLRKLHKDNQEAFAMLILKIETKDSQMTQERLERITMLMNLIKEDAQAKGEMAVAVQNNTKAIEINAEAIRDLHDLIMNLKIGKRP